MGLAQFSQTAKLVHFYDILAFNSKKLKWNKNDNLTRKILKFDINKIPVAFKHRWVVTAQDFIMQSVVRMIKIEPNVQEH